jgi:endo-1,4-beta-mannosidase
MSGVNWVPHWALGNTAGDDRFRVVSTGRIVAQRLASWYSEPSVTDAQVRLAAELAAAAAGHDALWAWDLGNENSNCAVAPSKASGRSWLHQVTNAIRRADAAVQVTVGLHMEDLEQDRNLGPVEAAEVCDFLTMHGYPGYAKWTDGPTDERLLGFLARVTRWLGGGADVLFSEFGVPTQLDDVAPGPTAGPELVSEDAAAAYIGRALNGLQRSGSTGAMLWCYSDYDRAIWQHPPLDLAVHERSFGLWHSDASPKPSVATISTFARLGLSVAASPALADDAWVDLPVEEFYHAPERELPRLYRRYCAAYTDV